MSSCPAVRESIPTATEQRVAASEQVHHRADV